MFLCDTTRWIDADGNQVATLDQSLYVLDARSDGTYAGARGGGVFGFDAAGSQLWSGPGLLSVEDITIDGAGNVVVAARYDVVKYSPDGTQLWHKTHDANVFAVATGPDESVVIAGVYEASNDIWVRKYAP